MLLAMFAIVSIGLLWSMYEWQQNAQTRLNKQLPHARAQLRLMQDQATELARLKGLPQKSVPDIVEVTTLLRSSAAARQLDLKISEQEAIVTIKGQHVPLEHCLSWLAEIQTLYRLKARSLQLDGRQGTGEFMVVLEAVR